MLFFVKHVLFHKRTCWSILVCKTWQGLFPMGNWCRQYMMNGSNIPHDFRNNLYKFEYIPFLCILCFEIASLRIVGLEIISRFHRDVRRFRGTHWETRLKVYHSITCCMHSCTYHHQIICPVCSFNNEGFACYGASFVWVFNQLCMYRIALIDVLKLLSIAAGILVLCR